MRLLSRLSMVLGAGLFVLGLGMRTGLLPSAARVADPGPSTTPAPIAAFVSPSPAASPSPPLPTAGPIPTPTTIPTTTTGELLFADDFDVEAAWPTGDVSGVEARYVAGVYVLGVPEMDLPAYLWAASGEGRLPPALVVDATFDVADAAGQAGLFVADASGARLGALVSPDGRVVLVRDSIESFDVLGTGSVAGVGRPIHLTLSTGPSGTSAAVDGHAIASIRESLEPAGFGVIVWAQQSEATVGFDRYEVRSAPEA